MILSPFTQRAANNIVLYYEGIKAKSGWCSSPFTSLYLYRSNSKGFQIEMKKGWFGQFGANNILSREQHSRWRIQVVNFFKHQPPSRTSQNVLIQVQVLWSCQSLFRNHSTGNIPFYIMDPEALRSVLKWHRPSG